MISTSEAISLVNKATQPLTSSSVSLFHGLNRILASDAIAEINLPPFNQSAMDGYALKSGGTNEFKVIGEIKAGDNASNVELKSGEAIKIFTGAMCPTSADSVCRIEDIIEHKASITVTKMPDKGANIRLRGEQIKTGETGLNKGSIMNPAAIGFLANLGIKEIEAINHPKINIISTGNELIPPDADTQLPKGKIYESNGIMLQAAIHQSGYPANTPIHFDDEYEVVFNGIRGALENSDVLIISGGISVGDYDFVGKALIENGVEQVFYKVSQKPGKPLFFGKKDNKIIFALPGNPAAALTCFYVYVLPALHKMSGKGFIELERKEAVLQTPVKKPNSREQFLKAYYSSGNVSILEGQSSAMLRTFAEANALVHLQPEATPSEGEIVKVITLS